MLDRGADEAPRFPLGRTVVTRGAAEAIVPEDVLFALSRHVTGDWGDLEPPDEVRNDVALATEGRLFSVYYSSSHVRFYVITEADRSETTVLLPHEY